MFAGTNRRGVTVYFVGNQASAIFTLENRLLLASRKAMLAWTNRRGVTVYLVGNQASAIDSSVIG
jgi:hypothetical protein